MNHLGMGVLINTLFGYSGREQAKEIYEAAIGKEIADIRMDDKVLTLVFTDKTSIKFTDDGQSCCESRYMTCDDSFSLFIGDTFQGVDLKEGPDIADPYGEYHEQEFLEVKTNKGSFTIANHVEHNGYYGGFAINISKGD